ncbi:AsmA family protein [Silvanigrella aquatica]|uniref:AsmA domain-containing protein n=1 Tax=Silvanigrella aquatica TaxID=1915309 RepID=A0A1L4CYM9_9BACT|nr:AsmA family protein [Silvanigrella aquatica]APJ03059.1 hypothetical protein AXG55_03690 [Silvanigrella aquatica]
MVNKTVVKKTMTTQNKWILGSFGVFSFIILILFILPFLINFNKFKPQIQNIVSQKLNAKIDFSSARLTIFTGLGIELENVKVENSDELFLGTELFKVKSIKFKTDLFPLLKGHFVGSVFINNPEVNFMRYTGYNNITSLIKKQGNNKNEGNSTEVVGENSTKKSKNEPYPFADKVLVKSFEIKDATFRISNISGVSDREVAKIKNLNILISNIGVGKDTKIDMNTDLDFKNDDIMTKGNVALNIILNTEIEGKIWKNSLFTADMNFNNLDFNYKDALVKKKNIPFRLTFGGHASPGGIKIEDLKMVLKSMNSNAKISVTNFEKLDSDIFLSLNSNNLSDMGEIFPQHKQMLLNGNLDFKAKVIGSLIQPENLLVNLDLKSKLSHSDINLGFTANSLKPLVGALSIQSQNLYLSKILKPFMDKEEDKKTKKDSKENKEIVKKEPKNTAPGQELPPSKDEFVLSDDQRKMLNGANFSMDINIGKLVYDDLSLQNIALNTKLRNYYATLNKFNMSIFSGNLSSSASIDLSPYPIVYSGSVTLNKAKVQEVFKFIKPDATKSPIDGNAEIKMNFNAKGITRPSISRFLNAKGSFYFTDGMLNTKSLISLTGQQFNQFVNNTSLGALKLDGNSLKQMSLSENDSTRRSLNNQKGDFEIKDGKLLLRNSITTDDGTLKLHADVGLDESLKGNAIYIASNNIKNHLLSQSKYAKYLLNQKGEFELELTIAGNVNNPEVTINTAVLQARLVKNATKELTNKVKEEIKKNPEMQKLQDDAKKLLEKNGFDIKQLGF